MSENNWDIIPSPREEVKEEPPVLKRSVSSIFRKKSKNQKDKKSKKKPKSVDDKSLKK